jgi:5-methylcytosine-specific restriction protein A
MFDALATLVDTCAAPRTADDPRPAGQRQAEALADACGFVLDHGSAAQVPDAGARRPHLNVLVRLEDVETAPARPA